MGFKQSIKKFLFEQKLLYSACAGIQNAMQRIKCSGNVKLENKGRARIKFDAAGKNNTAVVSKGCVLSDVKIRIRGNNNRIVFHDNCVVGEGCSFWMEGNDIRIEIGAGTTFTKSVHFCAQENGSVIFVDEDCMFSNNIIVRTSDSHPIYDENDVRINPAQNVSIGKHVWIAPNTKIMKGAVIGSGCVIGSDTMVGHQEIPSGSMAVGHPARVVKQKIRWTRENLF